MGVPIRVSNEIYSAAKKTATAEYRSISNQIEFWAQIGKCALENPDLPIEFLRDVLIAKNQDRSLAEPFIINKKND
jgi:hypothetical protein